MAGASLIVEGKHGNKGLQTSQPKLLVFATKGLQAAQGFLRRRFVTGLNVLEGAVPYAKL